MSYFRIFLNALLLLLVTPGLAIHARTEVNAPVEIFEVRCRQKVGHENEGNKKFSELKFVSC